MNCYKGDNYWRIREKEYDVPEPPEEQEDPQWHQNGPQYRSNDNGDGPAHVDDADIEKTEEDPQWHQIGKQDRSNNAGDGPAHVDDAEIEKTNLKTMARLGLGMGPDFLLMYLEMVLILMIWK